MHTKKILIVDDNHTVHSIFKEFFEINGYFAETARNGKEGVDKYRDLLPDVVLMDMQMPVMNGYESSKGIKTFDPRAKIVMVTGCPQDPLAKKYPLQLITPHHKFRTHSTFDNVAHLRAIYTHEAWINPKEAKERGILHGDSVKVFNRRGTIALKAKVTNRIMPGVVKIYQGAWYSPDENGIDRRGCVNLLIDDHPSPAGAMNFNTALVQVEKE